MLGIILLICVVIGAIAFILYRKKIGFSNTGTGSSGSKDKDSKEEGRNEGDE